MDIEAARAKLPSIAQNQNADSRRNLYAEMQIGALLDVAESLRVLALESARAMGPIDDLATTLQEDGPEPDLLTVGDVVTIPLHDGTLEVLGFRYTEGEMFVILGHGDEIVATVEQAVVHRLTGDEGTDPDPQGGVSIGEIEDAVAEELEHDDVEHDFDDAPPAEVDPLEKLKAKSKGKKKGAGQ